VQEEARNIYSVIFDTNVIAAALSFGQAVVQQRETLMAAQK
jgi:hypothetical protein